MSKRYEHFLTGLVREVYPAAVVGIDVTASRHTPTTGRAVSTEKLERWYATSSIRKGNSWGKTSHASGDSLSVLWSHLHHLVRRAGSAWVICPDAARVWPLLALWESLESSTISLCGRDIRECDAAVSQPRSRRTGLIVLEQSAHVLQTRWPDIPGRVTWVDTHNYGVELGNEGATCERKASECYDGWRAVTSVLPSLPLRSSYPVP